MSKMKATMSADQTLSLLLLHSDMVPSTDMANINTVKNIRNKNYRKNSAAVLVNGWTAVGNRTCQYHWPTIGLLFVVGCVWMLMISSCCTVMVQCQPDTVSQQNQSKHHLHHHHSPHHHNYYHHHLQQQQQQQYPRHNSNVNSVVIWNNPMNATVVDGQHNGHFDGHITPNPTTENNSTEHKLNDTSSIDINISYIYNSSTSSNSSDVKLETSTATKQQWSNYSWPKKEKTIRPEWVNVAAKVDVDSDNNNSQIKQVIVDNKFLVMNSDGHSSQQQQQQSIDHRQHYRHSTKNPSLTSDSGSANKATTVSDKKERHIHHHHHYQHYHHYHQHEENDQMTKRRFRNKRQQNDQRAEESILEANSLIQTLVNSIKIRCRTEWRIELPFDIYMLDSCARCYHYMPDTAFKPGAKFSYLPFGMLTHQSLNLTLTSNETIKLSFTFASTALVFKWQQCCADALLCCINYHKKYPNLTSTAATVNAPFDGVGMSNSFGQSQCPPTWDGWLCWDQFAQPNQLLERPCPKHIYWHQIVPPCRGYVTKLCNATGQWYVNEGNKEWSNYTMCARDDIYARRIQYSLVTNVISMCALVPALWIFSHYKQLSTMSRIRLHKHLFTSLLFHAIISALLKWHLLHSTLDRTDSTDTIATFDPVQDQSSGADGTVPFEMPSLCLVLSVLLRYFRSTNYLWMFNEALYLHQLIKHAFSQPSLRPLIILAYSLPFVTTTSYIFARYFSATSNLASIETAIESSQFDFNAQFSSSSFDSSTTTTAASVWSLNMSQPSMMIPGVVDDLMATTDVQTASLARSQAVAFYSHKQLNEQVQNALTSFIRLPNIRKHLRDTVDWQHLHHRPALFAWLHDLLADGGGGGANVAIIGANSGGGDMEPAPERLVSEYGAINSHKSKTSTPGSEQEANKQHVLSTLEVLEDVSPLIEEDNCWLMPSYEAWHEWIINVPNLAILIINCFFLVWLLRVLCIKAAATTLTSSPGQNCSTTGQCTTSPSSPTRSTTVTNGNSSRSYRPVHHHSSVFTRQSILVSLRAAVLLLPLYGLHYLFVVYRPKIENCWFSEAYHYLSLSLDGLQGLAVSVIFCFANTEIRYLLTRTLQRVGTRQRSTTIYMTEVAPTNRD